jgi:hypothetical protein
LPDRRLIVVADASFAAIDLIAALRRHVCLARSDAKQPGIPIEASR